MTLVIGIDGRVHQLMQASFTPWAWPQGHVDARMRQVTAAPEGSVVTCLACLYAWDRYRTYAFRIY